MAANIYELQAAMSLTAQTAIDAVSANLIRINSTTEDVADLEPMVEDNSDEIGRGSEFPDQSFLTAWKSSKKFGCYLSSEALAIAAAFGLGEGSGNTFSPQDPIVNANQIELPWMTVLEAIRPGASTQVFDRAFLGMVVDKWRITLGKGPGRANSKLEMDLAGTGKYLDPSGLTMPDRTPVHLLPAASLTCAINGTDYVTARSFESFDFEWDNAVRDGFFPGSGFQTAGDSTTGQIEGRKEFGKRKLTCSFSARYQAGSTELASLISQTQGTAVIGLSGAAGNDMTMTLSNVTFKTAKVANDQGIVTVKVDLNPLYDGNNLTTLITLVVNNSTFSSVGRA